MAINSAYITNSSSTNMTIIQNYHLCYYEPAVHDHDLYHLLSSMSAAKVPIGLVGIAFNIAAFVCICQPPTLITVRTGVAVYLKTLVILDIALLIITMVTPLPMNFCDRHHTIGHQFYHECLFYKRFIDHISPRIESLINIWHIWTLAALATHRYWKISYPLRARLNDTVCRARMIIVLLLVTAFVYRMPMFICELTIRSRPILHIGRNYANTQKLTTYRIIYHSICDPLFASIIPVLMMTVFSALTLVKINKSHRVFKPPRPSDPSLLTVTSGMITSASSRHQRRLAERRELRATISIVTITSLYLLFHSIQILYVARKWYLLITQKCPLPADFILSALTELLSMISATVNAFVFIAFMSRLVRCAKALSIKIGSRRKQMMLCGGQTVAKESSVSNYSNSMIGINDGLDHHKLKTMTGTTHFSESMFVLIDDKEAKLSENSSK